MFYNSFFVVGVCFIFPFDWIWWCTAWLSDIFSHPASTEEPELFRRETQSFGNFIQLYEAEPSYHRTSLSCCSKRSCKHPKGKHHAVTWFIQRCFSPCLILWRWLPSFGFFCLISNFWWLNAQPPQSVVSSSTSLASSPAFVRPSRTVTSASKLWTSSKLFRFYPHIHHSCTFLSFS